MTRTVKWTAKSGQVIEVTVALVTTKTVSCDGDRAEVSCCDITMDALVDQKPVWGRLTEDTGYIPKPYRDAGIVATFGKIGIRQGNLDRIHAAVAELKATPVWQANDARKAERAAQRARYEAGAACVRNAMAM